MDIISGLGFNGRSLGRKLCFPLFRQLHSQPTTDTKRGLLKKGGQNGKEKHEEDSKEEYQEDGKKSNLLTTNAGAPVADNQNVMTAGPRGIPFIERPK